MVEGDPEAKEVAGVAALVVVRSALAVTMMAMVEVEVEGSLSFKGSKTCFSTYCLDLCVFSIGGS
jgi:hypothetical protein